MTFLFCLKQTESLPVDRCYATAVAYCFLLVFVVLLVFAGFFAGRLGRFSSTRMTSNGWSLVFSGR